MAEQSLPASADIVVVGCGAAGLSAAIEAADRGADVVVLESQPQPAGSTRLSAGYAVFCDTELEPGPAEELYEDLLEAHHDDHDEALVRLYVQEAPKAYLRLKEIGVDFVRTFQFAHMRRPWGHEVRSDSLHGGAELGNRLEKAARSRGARIVTSARARKLIWDSTGRVTGTVVEHQGGTSEIEARSGVVLASGGFTRNPGMIRNYGAPGTEAILPITGAGSLGDGLTMALARGADTAYMAAGVAPTGPADAKTGKGTMVIYSGAILLNLDGERFCNESDLYNDISWAGLRQPSALMFQVYDARIREAYLRTMLGRTLVGYDEYVSDDLGDLLAEMAAREGLDAVAASKSICLYNEDICQGRDTAQGRTHMVGTSGKPVPIVEPPFYGMVTVPGTTHFNGGLKIDPAMRVIDVFDQPIPGLFAAGEVTGGFHGRGYLSGTHIGMALIFGQVAGRNAL
jgi:fumarate reductase flavoprotein subunit